MKTPDERKMKRMIRGNTTFVPIIQLNLEESLNDILNITSGPIPEHLTPRTDTDSALIIVLFSLCALIVAVARIREKQIFLYLFQGVFFLKPLDDLAKDEYKSRSSSSLLFLLLFITVTSGTIYWIYFVQLPLGQWHELLLPVFIPSIYFLYQLFITNLAARVTGNAEAVTELNYFAIILTQFFGLVFLVEFFVSYFQPEYIQETSWLLGMTYFVYLILRFLRGFWISIHQGVSWYYIILYFWTLEILPILIVVKLLYYDEFQTWIG